MRGLHHTGIIVSDLERSIGFYAGVLGLEMWTEPSPVFDDPSLGEALGVPGAALRMVTFRVGDGILELLEYSAPPSPVDCRRSTRTRATGPCSSSTVIPRARSRRRPGVATRA